MKVLHIITSDTGGAGIAAVRLHSALLEFGVNSKVLCLSQSRNDTRNIFKFPNSPKPNLLTRAIKKIELIKRRDEKILKEIKSRKGNYEIYSSPLTRYKIETHPLVAEADIINLHWVAGFLNYPTFFKSINKPLVWTLHDMNPLIGGFHYQVDSQRNSVVFSKLEKYFLEVKKSAYHSSESLTFVALNNWMFNNIQKNTSLSNSQATIIPNTLDLNIYKPHNKILAKGFFNIDPETKVLLFVSQRITNYRKGFDLLMEVFNEFQLPDDYILVAIGQKLENDYSIKVKFLGQLCDSYSLSLAYNAADALLIPSREDNLPNTMLEAMACGTPVIGTPVGGLLDVIKPGFNGLLSKNISAGSLKLAIIEFIEIRSQFNSLEIRNFIRNNFSEELIAGKYIQLYKRILESK